MPGRILGHPFTLEGEIQTGTGQGRQTHRAYAEPENRTGTACPKRRLRDGNIDRQGSAYRSVTNVGVRPTFNGASITIESHLFDFNENLTSGRMEVRFLERLRDERKFEGPEALREQVLKDIEEAREISRESTLVERP